MRPCAALLIAHDTAVTVDVRTNADVEMACNVDHRLRSTLHRFLHVDIWREAEIPREQFPRSILVAYSRDILARMSLTCHEKIGRVGRVGKDVTRMLRGNCFCGI